MNLFESIQFIKRYKTGKKLLSDPIFQDGQSKSRLEKSKLPKRTDILNYLLSIQNEKSTYLEIGVRNPSDNYNHVIANEKYSVDPGLECSENLADFKMTSDEFFSHLSADKILSSSIRFDVIFIDGLHLAEQADKDIENALKYIKDEGFVVLHDCNPPSEWHARENFQYHFTPAERSWNGTTWKAFLKWRCNPSTNSCCIDTDWGVGIISKTHLIGQPIINTNPFYEFSHFEKNKKKYLNLISIDDLKQILANSTR